MSSWLYPVTETITGSTKIKEADDKLQNAMDNLQDWVNSEGDWTGTGATLNYTTVDAMTDTDLTSPTEGQFLMLDGSDNWANATVVATDVGAITNGIASQTARLNITSAESYTAFLTNTGDNNALTAVGHATIQGHAHINQIDDEDENAALKVTQKTVGQAVLDLNTISNDQYNSIKFNHGGSYKWGLQSGLDGDDFALYSDFISDNVIHVAASGFTTIQGANGSAAPYTTFITSSYGVRAYKPDAGSGAAVSALAENSDGTSENYAINGTHTGGSGAGQAYGVRGALSTTGVDVASSAAVYGFVDPTTTGAGMIAVKGTCNSGQYGFYTLGDTYMSGTAYPFTAGHNIILSEDISVGDIVEASDCYLAGINNAIGYANKTTISQSKKVYGVLGRISGETKEIILQGYNEFYTSNYPTEVSYINKDGSREESIIEPETEGQWNSDHQTFIDSVLDDNNISFGKTNSIGEGGINVCEAGGNIESGDYICSSTVAGKGQKQSDDVLHSYTVAKALQDIVWANETIGVNGCYEVGGVKCKMVGCTYHCG